MTTSKWYKESDEIQALQNCDVGSACEFEQTMVKADDRIWRTEKASTPCEVCCFHERKQKTIKQSYSMLTQCPYIRGCMGHLRHDGRSVVFLEVEIVPVAVSKL